MVLWFPDLSHWQGTPDVGLIKAAGAPAMILKASEGASSTDGSFAASAAGALANGMLLGGYHFAQPGQSSGASQATRLAGLCADAGATLAVLDIEVNGGLGRPDLKAWCADFLGTLQAAHTGAVATYCGQSYANYLGDVLFANGVGRWIASPGYPPGVTFDLWQSSWQGQLPSIQGPVDINTWQSDLPSLTAWFGAAPITPPPPPEVISMLITYDNAVYSWNFGSTAASIFCHTNPDRVHDMEAHGIRHIQPTDPEYPIWEPVIKSILAAAPALISV